MQLAAEQPGEGLAKVLAVRPEVKVIDYTGSTGFGTWLERNAHQAAVFTEKAGVNTVVVDSTDDYQGMLANLAFSLSLYSGQMCTTPQNLLVPRDGITADGEHEERRRVRRRPGRGRRRPARRRRPGDRTARRGGERRRPRTARQVVVVRRCRARVPVDHPPRLPGRRRPHPDRGAGRRRRPRHLPAGVLRADRVPGHHREHRRVDRAAPRLRHRARRHHRRRLLDVETPCSTRPRRRPSTRASHCPAT